jgi:hypothetical protein
LTAGDRPELFFFEVSGEPAEVAVGISGSALAGLQRRRIYLSREQKIDLAGTLLRQRIEEGAELDSRNLLLGSNELVQCAAQLGIIL